MNNFGEELYALINGCEGQVIGFQSSYCDDRTDSNDVEFEPYEVKESEVIIEIDHSFANDIYETIKGTESLPNSEHEDRRDVVNSIAKISKRITIQSNCK